jgi:hypothetical protein
VGRHGQRRRHACGEGESASGLLADRLARRERECGDTWIAIVGIARHRPEHDLLQCGRDVRRIRRRRHERGIEGPLGEIVRRLAGERQPPRQQLVEHGPQPVDVRALVDTAAAQLLGCHVLGRPYRQAGPGSGGSLAVSRLAGDAEVGEQRLPLGVEQDVLGLDVAVDQAEPVRRLQPIGHLECQPGRLDVRQLALPLQQVVQ